MSGAPPPAAPVPGDPARAERVRAMFDALAPRYDLANRVLSLGLDQAWRRRAMRALGDLRGAVVVDLCAGTLDLTRMALAAGAARVEAVDFAEAMLRTGRARLAADAPVNLHVADVRALPLPDGCADALCCGFGLRNVPELERVLDECARVLRPGGRLVVLDFFRPETALSRFLQATYNRLVLPVGGGLITGFAEAYRYLAGSIDAFVTRGDFEALLAARGFAASGRDMLPPVASLVVGVRR